MRTTVATLLVLVCAVSAKWVDPSIPAPSADIARQYQSQDGTGKASYGYSHPGQSAVTHREADGSQIGSYAYISPEGREIRVNFIADADGYRVENNFAAETAEVAAARASHLAAHAAALAAAKSATPNQELWEEPPKKTVSAPKPIAPVQQQQKWTAPVQQPTWTAPVQQPTPVQATRVAPDTNWLAPEQYFSYRPQPVQETPEVQAAKAEFYKTYSAAAARAPKTPEPVEPKKETLPAPVQQQTWSAPAQQTWSAPAQQTWSAPAQQTWSTPAQQTWSAPSSQVQDTPDVQAAKAEFYRAYAEASARAEAAAREAAQKEQAQRKQETLPTPAVQQQTWSAPVQQQTYPAPVQQTRVAPDTNWLAPEQYFSYRPQPVQETPEVLAARAQFIQSYNAAAALAAQNPETVIGSSF